jgi:hypothetical protein
MSAFWNDPEHGSPVLRRSKVGNIPKSVVETAANTMEKVLHKNGSGSNQNVGATGDGTPQDDKAGKEKSAEAHAHGAAAVSGAEGVPMPKGFKRPRKRNTFGQRYEDIWDVDDADSLIGYAQHPSRVETDILEVWFAGSHGGLFPCPMLCFLSLTMFYKTLDVGGGNVFDDTPTSLANITLRSLDGPTMLDGTVWYPV